MEGFMARVQHFYDGYLFPHYEQKCGTSLIVMGRVSSYLFDLVVYYLLQIRKSVLTHVSSLLD